MSKNLTSEQESFVRLWVPFVAALVAKVLPEGMADAPGIETGVIFHFGESASFFAARKESRKWFTIAHRGSNKWSTKRDAATVWLNPAIANAEQLVRAMLEATVFAVFGDDINADGKRARVKAVTDSGILKNGKLSATVLKSVQALAKKTGKLPVAPLSKVTRTRNKSGNRNVSIQCAKSCTVQSERRKDPDIIKCQVSRAMLSIGWKCPMCGADMIVPLSKEELNARAKNRKVKETVETPE